MICGYFWPSYFPKKNVMTMASTPQNLEDWDGLLLGAVQIAPQAVGELSPDQPWCDPLLLHFFLCGDDAYCTLHKSSDPSNRGSSIGSPALVNLAVPWTFWHVKWQASNVAQQPPAPPNVPEAWALWCCDRQKLKDRTIVEDALLSQ